MRKEGGYDTNENQNLGYHSLRLSPEGMAGTTGLELAPLP